jgi:hypothetical protein
MMVAAVIFGIVAALIALIFGILAALGYFSSRQNATLTPPPHTWPQPPPPIWLQPQQPGANLQVKMKLKK